MIFSMTEFTNNPQRNIEKCNSKVNENLRYLMKSLSFKNFIKKENF